LGAAALAGLAAAALLAGCQQGGEPPRSAPAAAIAHGGAGSPPSRSDGCRAAVDAALAVLERGGSAVEAAVAGVVVMEDDPRFNAGTGSRVRLDLRTVQMDAAVMDSSGRFGGVAIIEGVKNPIRVAREVMGTPHLLLAGDGATRFARRLGFPPYDPTTPERRAWTEKMVERFRTESPEVEALWKGFDWRRYWNFARPIDEVGIVEPLPEPDPAPEPVVDESELGHDTVGVAVRAADGSFAVALSTGGTTIMLDGRIGDTPILGAGLFAGPLGAVAATGKGERIIESTIARRVHDWMAGEPPTMAVGRGVGEIRERGSIGLIAIGADSMSAAARANMAWAARELGSDEWMGPL
jgi:isoaspartyl peptidase/L-asparaginase-like protein (Ntn-hydrolase superfamily)